MDCLVSFVRHTQERASEHGERERASDAQGIAGDQRKLHVLRLRNEESAMGFGVARNLRVFRMQRRPARARGARERCEERGDGFVERGAAGEDEKRRE